jgi:hypothetical protein
MLAFAASSSAGLVLASTIAGAGGALDAFTRRALGVVLLVGAVVLGIRPLWALDGASPEAACHTAPGVHSGP